MLLGCCWLCGMELSRLHGLWLSGLARRWRKGSGQRLRRWQGRRKRRSGGGVALQKREEACMDEVEGAPLVGEADSEIAKDEAHKRERDGAQGKGCCGCAGLHR